MKKKQVIKSRIERAGRLRVWRLSLSCGHTSAIVAKGRLEYKPPKHASCGACEMIKEDMQMMQAIGAEMYRKLKGSR